VSLARNSPHISAPGRHLAAFSSSPLALLAASSSALRCIHPATNLCIEFLVRHTRKVDGGDGVVHPFCPAANPTKQTCRKYVEVASAA
jgi:hypothetical protein